MAYEHIIAKMTLEESVHSYRVALRLNPCDATIWIPCHAISDGPHGLRLQGEGANHLGIGGRSCYVFSDSSNGCQQLESGSRRALRQSVG